MSFSDLLRKKSVDQIKRDAELGYSDAHYHRHAGSDSSSSSSSNGGGVRTGATGLRQALGVVDLTSLGIAAIIGAGIFSMIGNAAFNGGPAVVFLFIFTATACAFSAMCYAEFAARLPVAGSAYTYAYVSFGELVAWIIGWDLLMEYAIGNIAVAISWSDYFTGLLSAYGIIVPPYLTMDFLTASRGATRVTELLQAGNSLETIQGMTDIGGALTAHEAWMSAPRVAGLPIVCDLPALAIVVVITALVFIGIQESKRTSNALVVLKLGVILMVIVLGAFYVNPANWSPFAPNGVGGVMKGVAGVFFAYIGFDALSTTAEECRDPQRDLPRAMILSLVICTVLYILVALVLTGMVSYRSLQVGDPLAYVFGPEGANLPWVSGIIAVSAVVALTTVLLVFQLGQPRIWMAMSRDGLLPRIFSAIHPRFRTPWFATLLTGVFVAVPALFMNLTEVTDLGSMGTLFAFVLVCGGVLLLNRSDANAEQRFRVPFINGKYIVPALLILIWLGFFIFNPDAIRNFFSLSDPLDPTLGVWEVAKHKIPLFFYIIFATVMAVMSFTRNLSLIPVLGLLSCSYLMTELGITNWTRFLLWLLAGLIIYFFYSYRHSNLNRIVAE